MKTRKLAVVPKERPKTLTPSQVLEYIGEIAAQDLAAAKKDLEPFIEEMGSDPARAFSWGQDAVRAAARAKVSADWLSLIENMRKVYPDFSDLDILAGATKSVREEMMHTVRFPEHSCSPISNYMSQTVMAERAAFLERCEKVYARMEKPHGSH